MKKFITVTKDQQGKIAKAFRCTDRMIRGALSFQMNSDLARRIRKMAQKMGAKTYVVVEEMESIFDSEGSLHQYFPNGAEFTVDKATGAGQIIYRGEVYAEFGNVLVSEIANIQKVAESL